MSQSLSPFVVILLGPPGSGKGTQSKRLSKDFNIPQISTGDLFREQIAKNTSMGQKAKIYIEAGQLVPDALVLDMLFSRIEQPDCMRGFLLDGFPRTIAQAEQLSHHSNMKKNLFVLCLEVSDEEIVRRASGRVVCRQCNSIYNREISPPIHENICDKCGGEVYRRNDDEPDVVRKRLQVYHAQTKPLIDYYAHLRLLEVFDGKLSPEVVHTELKRHIDHSLF